MAMVKTGDGITNITGKEGGTIFREDQCRQHAQAYPREIHREPTPKQKKRQRAFRYLLRIVKGCFTVEVTAYWQDWANKHPHTNKKGEVITLSWFQMFISFNINRVVAGESPVLLPPGYELVGEVPVWCRAFL